LYNFIRLMTSLVIIETGYAPFYVRGRHATRKPFNSSRSPVKSSLSAPGFAMNRISEEGGSCTLFSLKNSLSSRLIRFLFAAEPVFLLAVIPRRRCWRSLGQISTVKCSVLEPEPFLRARLNSTALSSFSSLPRPYVFMRRSRIMRAAARNGEKIKREKLDGQPLSSFCPPSIEDLSSGLGAHPG